MADGADVFNSKYSTYISQIEAAIGIIKDNLAEIKGGRGRTGHYTRIKEASDVIQQLVLVLRSMNVSEEIIGKSVRERMQKVLNEAIRAAGE